MNIANWFAVGEVGASSKVMAQCLLGVDNDNDNDNSYPLDPADFNRCIKFLDAVEGARKNMDIFRISEKWDKLIDNWAKIEKCFIDEVGYDWCNKQSAPKTYELMKNILGENNHGL
jgi:hypothetical protein